MALSRAQGAMIEKARSLGGGGQGVALTEGACAYVVGTMVADLGLKDQFPELDCVLPAFFGESPVESLELSGVDFFPLLERLIDLVPDADTYFVSLAKLHKTRLKYEKILMSQPLPTLEQVGPRALLEFGKLSPRALVDYIFWRKWIFDIDNRSGQETGYLFEPIIAGAIGGVATSAAKSPVRRFENPKKGRQVDCIKADRAYEFKLRVTIAASGQGRWREELEFPRDCRESGFVPVLVVLDGTPNPKLKELCKAFEAGEGEVYVGEAAWNHLNELAGPTMSAFLERYVHGPLDALLEGGPGALQSLSIRMEATDIEIAIGEETFKIIRNGEVMDDGDADLPQLPEDVDEEIVGP